MMKIRSILTGIAISLSLAGMAHNPNMTVLR